MAKFNARPEDVESVHFERATRSDLDGAVVLVLKNGNREILAASAEDGPGLLAEVRRDLGEYTTEVEEEDEDRFEDDGAPVE